MCIQKWFRSSYYYKLKCRVITSLQNIASKVKLYSDILWNVIKLCRVIIFFTSRQKNVYYHVIKMSCIMWLKNKKFIFRSSWLFILIFWIFITFFYDTSEHFLSTKHRNIKFDERIYHSQNIWRHLRHCRSIFLQHAF